MPFVDPTEAPRSQPRSLNETRHCDRRTSERRGHCRRAQTGPEFTSSDSVRLNELFQALCADTTPRHAGIVPNPEQTRRRDRAHLLLRDCSN